MKIHIYPKSMLETVWQQDKLLFTPEAEQPPLCLRCGQPLDHRLVINALSRYADVHICEACGMDEALRDANRCPLPLTEWAAVKNGLSQQQTDFEAPLLTTSCTFEDLFQQGSRPASEIAYSRSDYDGWKWWTTWHQCQKSAPIRGVQLRKHSKAREKRYSFGYAVSFIFACYQILWTFPKSRYLCSRYLPLACG